MLKSKHSFLLLLAMMLFMALPQAKAQFVNPVMEHDGADPSVILAEDGFYYMYSSEVNAGEGIRVWRSDDMVNWTLITKIFAQRPENVTYTFLWAPEVAYVNGKYLMFYANAAYGEQEKTQICVAESDKPYGPFVNNRILIRSFDSNFGALNANVKNNIDPSLFRDDDGKNYLIWGSFNGIYYTQLTDDCTALAPGATKKSLKHGTPGLTGDWGKIEAPLVVKRNGYYYLIASKGSTVNASTASGITYRLLMARSTSLDGAFKNIGGTDVFSGIPSDSDKMSGLLKGNDYVLGPGHCSQIVKDAKGQEWLFYHGFSKKTDGSWDYPGLRKLFISKVEWDRWNEGWPGILPPSAEPIEMPTVDTQAYCGDMVKFIYDADDLKAFSAFVNAGNPFASAIIMNDIDMSGVNDYNPIGTSDCRFQGLIEGNYHRILNLKINRPGVERQGLVGTANSGTQIKNLIIDGSCEIIGGNFTGAFIGRIDGSGLIQIINCGNEAYVKGGTNTSGFVGCDTGVSLYFDNCYNTGFIDGGNESAAFSGWGIDRLRNCWNTGRTMGCQGAGDGKWLSLARDYNESKNVNSYDVNSANNPVPFDALEGYSEEWLADGHLAYFINQKAGYDAWLQNVDADLNPIDAHPVFLPSHLPVLTDGGRYYNNKATSAYTRSTTDGRFGTLCLGYPTASTSGAVFYEVAGVRKSGSEVTALVVEEIADQQHLEAGKSYIFKATGSQLVCTYFNAGRPSSAVSTLGLVGNLIKDGVNVAEGNYLLVNNQLRKVTDSDNTTINLNRAYITDLAQLPEYQESAGAKSVVFGLDGSIVDGISNAYENQSSLSSSSSSYNLAGQRVGEGYRGIVIQHGRKVLVR